MSEQILIIGAGAVGQVYGYYLAKGGAKVQFHVREKYRDGLTQGCVLHQLSMIRKPVSRVWRNYTLSSTLAELKTQRWDQVWLAVPSTALRESSLMDVLRETGDALVVMLQPDINDQDLLQHALPGRQIVQGLINLISFQSPLPTCTDLPEGIAYLLPPAPQPFSGPAAQQCVQALKHGGMRARVVASVSAVAGPGAALLQTCVAVLETVDWAFAQLRDESAALAADSAREVIALLQPQTINHRALHWVSRPWALRLLLSAGQRWLPFNFERYMHYHFSKVGAQTRLMLESWQHEARRQGQTTPALDTLIAQLDARRASH
ncbi:MAG: 2-dehydropantoate 2-reductase [Gammaproteobacteria bacterium]|nr:2-dehydropantoate 2-reductase [Gammaproteobacteria bacterium]